MSFGDVIRSAHLPNNSATGIGGDANAIWHCDTTVDRVDELSTVDLSRLRTAGAPNGYVQGIGGDINTIWSCGTYNVRRVYELSTSNLATIRSASSPATWPVGIGGNANTIWCIDGLLYELSTVDFSAIRSASKPASSSPTGIGGDANTIWLCDTNFNRVYELSTVDFSVIRYVNSPSSSPTGIGGDADTIWNCDTGTNRVYELDASVPYPPVADAGGPYIGEVDEIVNFDGSGSTDVDGTIVLYEWDFGDSETGVGVNVNHIYTVADTYTIVLTVTDDDSLTDIDTTVATISEVVVEGIPDALTLGRVKKRRHRVEV